MGGGGGISGNERCLHMRKWCTNNSWRCGEEGDDIFSEWDVEDLENKEH